MTARRVGVVSATALAILGAGTSPAQAYLDPGTGSMILQGIIGAVAGALVALRIYWGKIKFFSSEKSAAKPVEDRNPDKD